VNKKEDLLQKIADRTIKVGVVGIGYVGLPLAVAFAQAGFQTLGIDLSDRKVNALNRGQSYIEDIPSTEIVPLINANLLRASSDYADLNDVEAIIICVPTPLSKTRDPDISFIIDATNRIVQFGSKGKLIVLESTTYPGTTDEIILPSLRENGDQVGRDVFLAFSPERIDPGRKDFMVHNTPKVIGGVTPDCLDVARALYNTAIEELVPVSSTSAAEMVKLLENTFRAVNIGLVNEMAIMCDRLGLNVWEVIDAAATKPYGFMPFYPGPGLGGHCIPIDPQYLSWKLRTLNYTARFIELASEVNSQMPYYVVDKVTTALNDVCKPVNGSRILVLGVAYKPDVSDVRESKALDIMFLLQDRGALVDYHDPFVPNLAREEFPNSAIDLTADALHRADCVVITTNHSEYDWSWIGEHAQLIVDTRNALKGLQDGKIYRL